MLVPTVTSYYSSYRILMKCFIVNRQYYSHPSHIDNTVVINLMGFVLLNLHFLSRFLLPLFVCHSSIYYFLLPLLLSSICFYIDFIIVKNNNHCWFFWQFENNICPFEQIKATKMIFSGGYLKYIEPIFYRKELEFLYLSHISVEITLVVYTSMSFPRSWLYHRIYN